VAGFAFVKLKGAEQPKRETNLKPQGLPAALLGGQPEIMTRWPVVLLAALTLVLSLPLFAPWSFWPVGYIAFVPWLLAIALGGRRWWLYICSYLLGAAFYLVHFRWLYETTPEGYLAASLLYLAPLYVPVAWVVRHLHRARGVSLAFAFPVAWVAQELLHSRGPLAFPWFLLGHSQIRLLSMVQIADLAGVYGVSFVLAAVNGLLADLLLRTLSKRKGAPAPDPRKLRIAGAFAGGLLVLTLLYGQFRLHQSTSTEGPLVSVVQGDFRLYTSPRRDEPSEADKRQAYMDLTMQALGESPDLVVLPETPWMMRLNKEIADMARRNPGFYAEDLRQRSEFQKLAEQNQVYITVGGVSYELRNDDPYARFWRFNSAFVFGPAGKDYGRYDKIHLVLFGEYVPFRYSMHGLYRFLNDGPWNPWGYQGPDKPGYDYSLTSGRDREPGRDPHTTFALEPRTQPGKEHHFGVTICYEDVIPQVFRRFVLDEQGKKRADFMLNISNDGWFGYGTQQAQHLVNCAFRAIENRVGIARSVNTGISGFIRPDGSRHDLVQGHSRWLHAGGSGYRTARVGTDSRVTLYSRIGDALPGAVALVGLVAGGDAGRIALRDWRASRPKRKTRRRSKRK
jgi:apolipoprotein N-acyltransferase